MSRKSTYPMTCACDFQGNASTTLSELTLSRFPLQTLLGTPCCITSQIQVSDTFF